jgi:hypothetical protein
MGVIPETRYAKSSDGISGPGLVFEPRGEYELKGVQDPLAAVPSRKRTVRRVVS